MEICWIICPSGDVMLKESGLRETNIVIFPHLTVLVLTSPRIVATGEPHDVLTSEPSDGIVLATPCLRGTKLRRIVLPLTDVS
jgi:hypothetical protein